VDSRVCNSEKEPYRPIPLLVPDPVHQYLVSPLYSTMVNDRLQAWRPLPPMSITLRPKRNTRNIIEVDYYYLTQQEEIMVDIQMSLADLVLQVKNVKRSASFYRHALGFTMQGEPTDEQAWLWIGEPGASQHLGLYKEALPYEIYSPNPEGKRWGATHFILSVPAKQLEAAVRQVRLRGIEVRGPQQLAASDSVAFYFYDFDGNLIALRSR